MKIVTTELPAPSACSTTETDRSSASVHTASVAWGKNVGSPSSRSYHGRAAWKSRTRRPAKRCSDNGLLGLDVGEPAGRFQQTVVIGPAAGAALEVDRGAWVHLCRVFPGQLQLNVGVEDVLARGASCVSILGAQQLVEPATVSHQAASSSTGCPAAAILARRLRLAPNRFL